MERSSASGDSIRVYQIYSLTRRGVERGTRRDSTTPECRKRLCGMMTAPTVPTACVTA